MMYKHLLRDFAERTFKNLEMLEKYYGPDDRYEVTQLVNSLLGLVVFPKEKALQYIPTDLLSDLKAKGWPTFDVRADNTGCDNLRKLIENLRHGTAHDNITFEDSGGKIAWLTFSNKWQGKHWEGRISVADLRVFIKQLSNLLADLVYFPRQSLKH